MPGLKMPVNLIPMASDVASLVGPVAERVENRSLLLDKFLFHKAWPPGTKRHEASRWSLLRIADGGTKELREEADRKRHQGSRGRQQDDHLVEEAEIAAALANVRWNDGELWKLRLRRTRRFLRLFRSAYGGRARVVVAQLEGRLAINLADGFQNAGTCLDRLFGLPYIPGSAIKGVCRHVALAHVKAAPAEKNRRLLQDFCLIFGTSKNDFEKGELNSWKDFGDEFGFERKGSISFLPAYPLNEAKIIVDLTNVHYPEYYRTGRTQDLRKEELLPNPFPAIEVGGQFAFCLVLSRTDQRESLLTTTLQWLEEALKTNGLGAKTAAGYGWFSIRNELLEQLEEEQRREAAVALQTAEHAKKEAEARQREMERKARLSPEESETERLLTLDDQSFAMVAKNLANEAEPVQRAFIALLRNNKDKRERWKTWKRKRADLVQTFSQVCEALKLPILP